MFYMIVIENIFEFQTLSQTKQDKTFKNHRGLCELVKVFFHCFLTFYRLIE